MATKSIRCSLDCEPLFGKIYIWSVLYQVDTSVLEVNVYYSYTVPVYRDTKSMVLVFKNSV